MASLGVEPVSLGDKIAQTQAAANLLGRLTLLRDVRLRTGLPLPLNTSSKLMQFADALALAPDDPDAQVYMSFHLPPTGATEYLRNLTPVTRDVFDGLTKQYQQDAFTIAGVGDQQVLAAIQAEMTRVVAAGGTPDDFRRAVDALTSNAGVARISDSVLDTTFRNQANRAYSSGRYEQMTDEDVLDALPYWQYFTVGDDRVRPEHRVLNGFCALAADPVWRKIYPPCGWGCRCSTAALTAKEAPEGSDDDGLLRLPALAIAKVPTPGYEGILGVVA